MGYEQQQGAALASAPLAGPSDETLRLAGVIADKTEDGTLFEAGIFSRRELADKVRAVMRFVQQGAPVAVYAAPQASEAHGLRQAINTCGSKVFKARN